MRKPVDTGLLNIISAWLVTRLMASRTVANPLR
jgi:hypothetical protein